MTDVRLAATSASNYLKGFYPEADNIRLEEVELTEDENHWFITLSYEPNDQYSINFNQQRRYKIFKLRAKDGIVQSMKIRELQGRRNGS